MVLFDSERDALRLLAGRYSAAADGKPQLDVLISQMKQGLTATSQG